MLKKRQIEILLELFENARNYMTASEFTKKFNVSLRTVQNDMRQIRLFLQDMVCPCVRMESEAPKGTRIVVTDPDAFDRLKVNLYQEYMETTANSLRNHDRIRLLLLTLLDKYRPISYYELENTLFVSHSTLINDLRAVDGILQKYHLDLMRNAKKIMIDGYEIGKRLCISKEGLYPSLLLADARDNAFWGQQDQIRSILVKTFVYFKREISEVALTNATLFLNVALYRMKKGFFISSEELVVSENLDKVYTISKETFRRIENHFILKIPDAEISYFAVFMKALGNYTEETIISPETDDFILNALREIRSSFGIDLTNDMNLRTALGLHCSALFLRITYNMQMKNHLVDHIRQTYPQGFDIASFFASLIEKNIEKKMTGEEIAYLAVHLYSAIAEKQKRSDQVKVLIISSLRRSENLLLRQTLIEWFPDIIYDLFFLPPEAMNESYLDNYDIFLTTEKGNHYNMGLAMYINQFPTRQDYLNLKLAMDGFQSIQDILDIFHRGLYVHFDHPTTKEQILQDMCRRADEFFGTSDLYDAVMTREDMRSTFFGNSTAAPHPLVAVSSNTFVCIGISDTPIQWDPENNMVNLILLIDVSKNNAKAFQIWNYLSNIFADRTFVPRLLKNPCYDQFIELLKTSITSSYNMPI